MLDRSRIDGRSLNEAILFIDIFNAMLSLCCMSKYFIAWTKST